MLEVALSIVHWVLTPFRWAWKTLLLLREARTLKQKIIASRDLLVRELRHNARIIEEYDHGAAGQMGNIQITLKSDRWQQGATEWSVLRRSNEALWSEIADAYDGIELTRGTAAQPPTSAHLTDLAQRLSEAQI